MGPNKHQVIKYTDKVPTPGLLTKINGKIHVS